MLEVIVDFLEFTNRAGDQCDVVGLYHKSSIGSNVGMVYLGDDSNQ